MKYTRNLKKSLFWAIAIAIALGLVITSAASVSVPKATGEINELTVTVSNKVAQKMSVPTSYMDAPIQMDRESSRSEAAFAEVGDQLHPALGRAGNLHMAAYTDVDFGEMIWTFSTTDGPPYDPGVYYSMGGDYPSIKHWDGTEFRGTHVTDYLDLNGGPTYLFKCTDPSDSATYEMTYWDWSDDGWSDMIDADIACDSSQQPWEWGVSSYVTTSTYGSGYTDGPTITYADEVTEGSGWISWYYYDNCAHTDVDIDRSIIYSYAVYDWNNGVNWQLLCRVNDFAEIMNGFDTMYEIDDGSNLQYPAVAAGDGNIVILAETDVNGNKDIICFYGTNVNSLQSSFVVSTGDDERFPDVRHAGGQKFVCTYVKDGNLYALKTEDGGATWTDSRWQVNDGAQPVEEEYKTSDLCELGAKAMWEEDNGDDIDIYIGEVLSNDPPGAPTIDGPASGKAGTSYDYDFTATDPEGEDVYYYVDWGDGTFDDWFGPFASGTAGTASHTWEEQGDYTITAKAKDTNGLIGPEATLPVTMPRNRAVVNTFFSWFLEKFPNAFPILKLILG